MNPLFIDQPLNFLSLECKMFLREIAKRNHNAGGNNFRNGRV